MAKQENMGLKKKYVTYWRPDGEPVSVNISDKIMAGEIIAGLEAKGCTSKKPAVTAEQRRAKEAKAAE